MDIRQTSPLVKVRSLLESIGTPFTVARYQPRETIFVQGDACDSVMHIDEGRVRLSVSVASGKEAVCGLVGAGSFLGDEVLSAHSYRRQTATAMVPTELLVVSKTQMSALLRTNEAFSDYFIAHTLARKTSLENDLTVQLLYSSEQRLVHALLALADCDGRAQGVYALPKVSQETIAEMIGTTRSRVNLFMNKFKKLGFVEKHDGLLQLNASHLGVVRAATRAAL